MDVNKMAIENMLKNGRNVVFVPENYEGIFSNDFVKYLWQNFVVSIQSKGNYFHIDTPLTIEEKIKEMTYDEAEELFLTDDKIDHDICYKGWDFGFDNQTGAAYFHDPKSGLELYCSPSFEGEWGRIVYSFSSQYNFEDGDNTLTIEEQNVIDMAGDIKGQFKKWQETAHAIIDDVEHHVKCYQDFVIETAINDAVYDHISSERLHELIAKDREAMARIDALKDALIAEVKKSK